MAKSRNDPIIRLRFVRNVQTGTTAKQQVDTFSNSFARLMLQQVAVAASDNMFLKARARLMARLRGSVNAELTQMATMVAKFSVQPDGARGLAGTITSADTNASQLSADQRWGSGFRQYDLGKSGVTWRDRSFTYMLNKEKRKQPLNWWELSGNLVKRLGQKAFYTTNFGPVRVDFKKTDSSRRIQNLTSLGRGRPSLDYQVGTVTVSVLGRITPDMLPALNSDDPYTGVGSARSGSKVTSLIKDDNLRNKLNAAPRGHYRSLLEPFLSYYLTRAIPNAVSRVVENTVQSATAGAGRGRAGVEDFSMSGGGGGRGGAE